MKLKNGYNKYGSGEVNREWEALDNEEKLKYERIENPGKVDEALWSKAKEASRKAFGREKWPFITWWYEKRGGTFG